MFCKSLFIYLETVRVNCINEFLFFYCLQRSKPNRRKATANPSPTAFRLYRQREREKALIFPFVKLYGRNNFIVRARQKYASRIRKA